MAAFIRLIYELSLAGPPIVRTSSYHFIRKIVYGYNNSDLTAFRNQGGIFLNFPNAAGVMTTYHLRNIGNMYIICDTFTNPDGTFDAVIAALEAEALPADTINPSQRGFVLPPLEGPISAGPPAPAAAPPVAPYIGGAKLKYRNKTKRNSKKNDTSGKKRITRRNRYHH